MATFSDRLRIDDQHLRGALSGVFCCRIRILNPVPTESDHSGPWQPMLVADILEEHVRHANMGGGSTSMVEYEHREMIRHTRDDTRPILMIPHF